MITSQDFRETFHTHLDECEQCEHHPFELCAVGAFLLAKAVNEKSKAISASFRLLLIAAILLVTACTTPTEPCVRGDPVLAENGDTLGWVCTNYGKPCRDNLTPLVIEH